MVTLAVVLSALNHDWFAALDLHIANLLSQRSFFTFVISGQHYQYIVLPFSLSSSPQLLLCGTPERREFLYYHIWTIGYWRASPEKKSSLMITSHDAYSII